MANETETKFDRFVVTSHKGIQLRFENGWAVSVQWGPGNYTDCEGGRFGDYRAPKIAPEWGANSAEVAVFVPEARASRDRPCGNFLTRITPWDDVAGYVSSERVAALLAAVAAFSPVKTDASARSVIREILGEAEDE